MKKDKYFLGKVLKGSDEIISLLENDKNLKNIKDDKGYNIFHYLISGNQLLLTETLINKKLVSLTLLRETIKDLIKGSFYDNDNYINFLNLVKEEDKLKIIDQNINFMIRQNNIKTINLLGLGNISQSNKKNIDFIDFIKTNKETFDYVIEIYKEIEFNQNSLVNGFSMLKNNKIKTCELMESLKNKVTPFLYEDLSKVNEYCIEYLENRNLYKKLEIDLIEKKNIGE